MAMTMNGEYQLPVPRETVWQKLNDAENAQGLHSRLQSRSTKCQTPNSEGGGRDQDRPGEGEVQRQGQLSDPRSAGTATGFPVPGRRRRCSALRAGGATVKLRAQGRRCTLLSYTVEAQIGGKLAQLGQRLVNGAAKKLADDFFQKFAASVSSPSA